MPDAMVESQALPLSVAAPTPIPAFFLNGKEQSDFARAFVPPREILDSGFRRNDDKNSVRFNPGCNLSPDSLAFLFTLMSLLGVMKIVLLFVVYHHHPE
ncbi:MAG: hypothetical protein LBE75_02895 [Burkholderiales bacterium]|jgi:hypothetical protein|nr:hypothetical protein [Burkholderiales bacterium]